MEGSSQFKSILFNRKIICIQIRVSVPCLAEKEIVHNTRNSVAILIAVYCSKRYAHRYLVKDNL